MKPTALASPWVRAMSEIESTGIAQCWPAAQATASTIGTQMASAEIAEEGAGPPAGAVADDPSQLEARREPHADRHQHGSTHLRNGAPDTNPSATMAAPPS